jgi:Mce-associated membrane protein
MTAAARAAAKRAQRPAGRTVLVEPPENGWEDPPEPAPESVGELSREEETSAGEKPSVEKVEESASPWRSRRRLFTAVLCVLLAAGLVAVAVLGLRYREGQRAQAAGGQALAAARKAAPVVLSYDYRHLDQDFSRARACLTGAFRDQYLKTTKTVVGPTATKYHGVVKATVAAASVVSAAPDKVVTLLFVNQVTQSTQVSGSRLDLNRVRMTLTRTSAGWKVSAVDAL